MQQTPACRYRQQCSRYRNTALSYPLLMMVMWLSCWLANSVIADTEIGTDVDTLPLFDAHMHYKREAWEVYPPAIVIELMDKSGVAMALVSSTPDEGTIRLWEYAPGRIVPELRPYHNQFGPSNWLQTPQLISYLQQRLEVYPHQGIGEIHIHQLDTADLALLQQISLLAKNLQILMHVHSGAGPIQQLFEFQPELIIIWAHAGMSATPAQIREMFAAYKTLYVDTSYRESEILGNNGELDPEWRQLIIDYPQRFMLGSDTWINSQWDNYSNLMQRNRQWLSRLPRDVAELIAYKNAMKLFKREIRVQQVGND